MRHSLLLDLARSNPSKAATLLLQAAEECGYDTKKTAKKLSLSDDSVATTAKLIGIDWRKTRSRYLRRFLP